MIHLNNAPNSYQGNSFFMHPTHTTTYLPYAHVPRYDFDSD